MLAKLWGENRWLLRSLAKLELEVIKVIGKAGI